MPKSKKKKNQDFQKVKLKVGRKLQKADNVTNASFKTRSVQVVQHIKTGDGNQPTTRRNLSIGDLLNQCQHYSTTVRLDAVNGLRELLSSHPELLEHRLSQTIDRISQLMVDKDPAVRSALIKLFRQIVPSVHLHKIRPFFPIVSAHVCCAMTHIYEDIQSDSLQVLDIFLEYYPSLIVDQSSQIIPNFIEQISHQNASKKFNAGSRSLSVKPDGKIQAHKWRIQVLSRLGRLMSTLIESTGPLTLGPEVDEKEEGSKVIWRDDEEVTCSPCPRHFQSVWTAPGCKTSTMKNLLSVEMEERGFNLREPHGVLKLLETIVPILLECWVEATATQHKAVEGSLLSVDACSLRHNVVKIIKLLWQYAGQVIRLGWQSSVAHFLPDFHQHFMKFFPYSAHTSGQKSKKTPQDNEQQHTVHSLNITICDIMSYFLATNQTSGHRSSLPHTVTQYFLTYLQEEGYDSSNTPQILQVVERLLEYYQNNEQFQQLLWLLVSRFTHIHHLSKEKKLLLNFFSRIVSKEGIVLRDGIRQVFLDSLPSLFKSCIENPVMSGQIMGVLCDLAIKSTEKHNEGVTAFVMSVLEMDLESLVSMDNKCMHSLIELIYRVPQLNKESYGKLRDLVQDVCLPLVTCQYLLQVMQQRYNRYSLPIEEQGFYIQFLLKSAFDPGNFPLCHAKLDRDHFKRLLSLTETVSDQLLMFENSDQVVEVLCCYLSKTMVTRNKVEESVYPIVTFATMGSKLKIWNYPISRQVTNEFLDLLWSYSLAVSQSDKDSAVNSLIFDEVMDRCGHFISGGEQVFGQFLKKILKALKDCSSVEEVNAVQHAAILILQQDQPWPTLAENLECQPIFDTLEKIEGLTLQHRWKKLKNMLTEFNKT
ncbi:testis-expressed protein 10 homolog [Saccostrea echinata]|uniref:testis-expressed protein 10 homolog n=1 Tax=Saccostrea echinata TaxID=191078 RepID=UPI002A8361DA|nr:testis-expressed protein 10 homolog [Saccostrea echinata]